MNSTLKGPESKLIFLQPATEPDPEAEHIIDEPLSVTSKLAISPVVALVIVTGVLSAATPTIFETPEQFAAPLFAMSSALLLIR